MNAKRRGVEASGEVEVFLLPMKVSKPRPGEAATLHAQIIQFISQNRGQWGVKLRNPSGAPARGWPPSSS